MGLSKWWLTYGPGSPGSIARAMAKSYLKIKLANPGASENDLLYATLTGRYATFGGLDIVTATSMVEDSEGNLYKLSIQVWQREDPRSLTAAIRVPQVYLDCLQIIKEETAKIVGNVTE